MRLKKENPILRNERKKLFKNKTLFEGNQITRTKNENNYENKNKKLNQRKEKLREKNLNHLATNHHLLNNSNVYKPNRKLFSKQNIIKDKEKYNIYSKDIKFTSDNIIKNPIINRNIITKSNHNYIKSEDNEKINDNLNNKIMDNIPYENNSNINNQVHYNRISRMNNEINNLKRKYRIKNTSVELRHRRRLNNEETNFDDIDENYDSGNLKTDRNGYYSNLYKSISPESNSNNYKYETCVDFRKDILNDKIGEIYNGSRNANEGSQKMIYHFNKKNNNYFNIKRNDLISRNENNNINLKEDKNRTANNFYVNGNSISTFSNMNINYFNYINSKNNINLNRSIRNRQHVNSMIIEDNNQYSSFDIDNNNTYINNYRNEGYKSSRRSKNKIKITKSNNPNIVEYNLDISDIIDDNDEYKSEFDIRNFQNKYNRFNNLNFKKEIYLQKYYITKDIRPIITTQFSLKGMIKSDFNINNITRNNEITLKNHIESTPNFSERDRSPKRSNSNNVRKISSLNNNINIGKNNNIIGKNININIEDDNICSNKILIKKRPKNDIPKPSLTNKRKNTSSSLISNKSNRKLYCFLEICKRDNININSIKESNDNKLCFENENEIIAFINKKYEDEKKKKSYFNKKLRFTGFVLSKKYKGKNLYDIRIEDDLDKINHQLKEEQVNVNNKKVQLAFIDDKNNVENNNTITNNDLEEEIQKLKKENEKLNKKDISKNDLIAKLDKEKQNLLEEIEKMKKNIEDLNNINIKLNKDLDNKMNKKILLKKENNSFFSIIAKNKKININKENINKNDIFKNYFNIRSNDYKNKSHNKLDINQILYDLINGEKINEKINENNINNKSDIDNNIKELNNNKKLLDLIEGILKIDEINKKLNLEDNKDIINNSSINESSINEIEIYNQSHPRINDLLSEMSEKEEFNNNNKI